MNLPIRKTKIKDCEYTIKLLDGDSGFAGFGTLAKYAGGPIGYLLAAGSAGESPSMIADALRELGAALGSPEMRDLMYQMLEGSTVCAEGGKPMPMIVGGNREIFKHHFTGKPGQIAKLALFALKENYSDFFDVLPGLDGLVQRLKSLDPGKSDSQPATTG